MPTIDQLSEEQRAQVLEHHRDWNVTHEWWDTVYEDAMEIGATLGFDIDKIYFSGFWSQGDGACFEGRCAVRRGAPVRIRQNYPQDTELHTIADMWVTELRRAGGDYGWTCTIKHSGHYCHENCTDFSWDHEEHPWEEPDNYKALQEIPRRFMRWIYAALEKEHDYLTSDEAVLEALEANDIEFEIDEDGKLLL